VHEILTIFGCSFIFVALKALQQRNVAFDNYIWVVPTSVAMGFVEYGTIILVVKGGYTVPSLLAAGLGAGFGALSAMLLHKRYIKKNNGKEKEGALEAPTQRA
jgi:hypothetical protein